LHCRTRAFPNLRTRLVSYFSVHGPLLFANWYRPPAPNEVDSINSFKLELTKLSENTIGSIVVGDLNVHHVQWLYHSTGVTTEGKLLHKVCLQHGLRQLVKEPTRINNLLDLVLTDLDDVNSVVLPQIGDHSAVLTTVKLATPEKATHTRTFYVFSKANWKKLNKYFSDENWQWIKDEEDVDVTVEKLTQFILEKTKLCIPSESRLNANSSHEWINSTCEQLIKAKHAAWKTPQWEVERDKCNAGLLVAHQAFINRTKEKLHKLKKSTKKWWKLSHSLANRKGKCSSIPPLKNKEGAWVRDGPGKAELFRDTFLSKYELHPGVDNEYSDPLPQSECNMADFYPIRERNSVKYLKALNEDSATGPDLLAARILKKCATSLGRPVAMLARKILSSGKWPTSWKVHWIPPLHKKKAVFDAKNYRGLHITPQLSKVVERLLGVPLLAFLEATDAYGLNQFAYRKQRGCKDALLLNVLEWLWAFQHDEIIALYCSDVSGAFDRVKSTKLLSKLERKGVPPPMLKLLESWLDDRIANVVVEGCQSSPATINNMVYQGTVWGPPLWNVFFRRLQRSC